MSKNTEVIIMLKNTNGGYMLKKQRRYYLFHIIFSPCFILFFRDFTIVPMEADRSYSSYLI